MEKQAFINVCENALSMLLEYWKTDAGAAWDTTMKDTIIGLNDIKQYFIAQ